MAAGGKAAEGQPSAAETGVSNERQDESGSRALGLVGSGDLPGLEPLEVVNEKDVLADTILGNPDSRDLGADAGGRDSGGAGVAGRISEPLEVVPTGGQKKKKAPRPPGGKKVLSFKLPTSGQKRASSSKKKTSLRLPTGGQQDETDWLKSLLPTPQKGDWWEAPADDQGLKIKYRWRACGQKNAYVFRRLGKRQIQILKGQPYDKQVWLIADRIFGELETKGRADIAARLSPRPVLNRVAGANH